jgi:serine/alanine adding enzyme
MLKLLKQSDLSDPDWASFVENHPQGNIFQTPDFFGLNRFVDGINPFVFGVEEDQKIVALVTGLIIYNGRFFKTFTSRAIITGGPLIIPGDEQSTQKILSFLLRILRAELRYKVIYTQFRNLWDWEAYKTIFSEQGFTFEDHLDIHIDLRTTEDVLWSRVSRDRKKSIKKGANHLKVEEIEKREELYPEVYLLLKNVYARIKLPLPDENYFFNIFRELRTKNHIKIFGAFNEVTLIGVRVVLCYKQKIYDWYAGADDRFLIYRPNDVLPWTAIKWGIDQNYAMFDFGGAGKPGIPYGVREYKIKFGGQLVNLGRFTSIHKKVFYKLGVFGLKLYKIKV